METLTALSVSLGSATALFVAARQLVEALRRSRCVDDDGRDTPESV